MQTPEEKFLEDTMQELNRARRKFPSATLSTVALMEEVGELAQARLKVRAGKWDSDRIYAEAIQVAAMAMRVALEDDPSMNTAYVEP